MYELFKYDKSSEKLMPALPSTNPDQLRLSVKKLSFFYLLRSKRFFIDLYWLLNTRGNCWVYSALDNDTEVHYSYVTNKCYKYPFMKSMDVQIGNCHTDEKYRGYGIYPYVIQQIVKHYLNENPNRDIFMLVESSNHASQKGIEKIGFEKINDLDIIKIFGLIKIYVIKSFDS